MNIENREPDKMDMLIKLYDLPDGQSSIDELSRQGIVIRRAMSYECSMVVDWVHRTFNSLWADECSVAFGRQPIGCYIAVNDHSICGFCCLDTTFRNFIGPIGIKSGDRKKGLGRSLLLAVAQELRLSGFAYAVIGDVGQAGFFTKSAGAVEIPDSTPGAYPDKI